MKKQNNVNVIQDPAAPVAVEVLAEAIVQISQGVKKMLAGPLNEAAIVLLITNATPQIGGRYNRKAISASTVKAVLTGIESLEREYLKPRKPSVASAE